jgi:hypothetical protein
MVAQLNGAFDMAFNGQIFAAVQLAFDDDGFPIFTMSSPLNDSPQDEAEPPGSAGGCGAAVGCPLVGRTPSSRFHM